MIRHYLHGDASETQPGAYYCDRCDLFATRDHFTACSGNDYERYERAHRRFSRARRGDFTGPKTPKTYSLKEI